MKAINKLAMFQMVVMLAFALSSVAHSDEQSTRGNTAGHYGSEITVVNVDANAPMTLNIAVRACAGLKNRKLGGSVYIQTDAHDEQWLKDLDLETKGLVNSNDFLNSCLVEFPACVRYSFNGQRKLLPNILTVAAVLGAIPLDVDMAGSCSGIAFDAPLAFAENNTPYLATKFVFENYAKQTTGLAMLNPGYSIHAEDLSDPEMTGDAPARNASRMIDFVFSQKLFVTFLVNGCVDDHPENDLFHDIVNAGIWDTPLGVYGYNNSWLLRGGFFYEAQTKCLKSRNMGAIPTETNNLSFFSSRRPPVEDASQLQHNAAENIEYDPGKTYVAFVVGDGDNINYIMTSRKEWLRQRLSDCEKADNACAPLTWSISPHLSRIAPDVLEWYYGTSKQTGKDYFILPPSGHLYAYPTSLNNKDQKNFILATERDARVLGVQSVVHWDWFDTWRSAENGFLPKYARAEGAIRGIFPVNVPYMFPAFPWWPSDKFYNVLAGKDGTEIVVFRPRTWRGVDGKGHREGDEPFSLTPQDMANELGGYPRGTVTWVYMTSDGGLTLENSFMELVEILPPHVQLVSADTATRLALSAMQQ